MKKQEQNTKETVSMLVYGYLVILFAGLPLYMQNKLVMIGNAKYLFFFQNIHAVSNCKK